jgi:hypothetical protein
VVCTAEICTFAKIVLSLPFLTVRDVELNEKILKCVVLLQYKYIDNTIVTVCENRNLLPVITRNLNFHADF